MDQTFHNLLSKRESLETHR